MPLQFEDLPPLEEPCDKCNGAGRGDKTTMFGNPSWPRCTNCYGRGTNLTVFGKAICNLITKYNPLEEEFSEIRRLSSKEENDY